MSADWVTAIATVGTFVVIAASAVAALVQLRHMRGSNQIAALTEIRATLESPEFLQALRFVQLEFPRHLQDPERREQLLQIGPTPDEYFPVRTVSNFFESFGVFVKRKIIDRDIACDTWGQVVLNNWNVLSPFILNRRAVTKNPALFENFEYLASVAKTFGEAHPHGTYPANVERMPLADLWPETRAALEPAVK